MGLSHFKVNVCPETDDFLYISVTAATSKHQIIKYLMQLILIVNEINRQVK